MNELLCTVFHCPAFGKSRPALKMPDTALRLWNVSLMKIQKIIFGFCFSILSTVSTFAGGDVVNNGGGASEMTIVYAHQNYGSLVEVCTRTLSCELTSDEKNLLLAMMTDLEQEQAVDLSFHSTTEMGQRLFSTGNSVGSKIEINKDQLWKSDLSGLPQFYALSDALELLTLAWSQHHPQFAEKFQISLAQKLATYALVGKAAYLPYLISSNLRLLMVKNQKIDQMYLEDGYDSFLNLHQLVLEQLTCKVSQFSIYAFQWSPEQLKEENGPRILLNGRIGWKCLGSETSHYTASLSISFKGQPISVSTADSDQPKRGTWKIVDPDVEMNLFNIKETHINTFH
jgi:hypothetical protein